MHLTIFSWQVLLEAAVEKDIKVCKQPPVELSATHTASTGLHAESQDMFEPLVLALGEAFSAV